MIIFTNYQIIEKIGKRECGLAIHEHTHKENSMAQREAILKWGTWD